MVISFIATWFKRLGAICLAFVILWHLTSHDAPRRGKAVVHLALPDHAVVWIDRDVYRVNSAADSPVVRELAPGRHVAQVWRQGFMEGEEAFTVEPGRVAIVGPLDRATAKARAAAARMATSAGKAGPADRAGPAGLTAHIQPVGESSVTN